MEGGTESLRVAQLIERQGIDFAPTDEFLDALKALHAKDRLLDDLKRAKILHPAGDAPTEQAAYAALLACEQADGSGQYTEGETQCSKAESAEASTAYFAQGLLAQHQQKWTEAVRFFKAAVQAGPLIPDNYNYLGIAFQDLGDLEQAEAECREAIRLDPEYETPVNNLAYIYLVKKDASQAERYARQAIGLMGNDASAHWNLGLALFKEGKPSDGLQELLEAEKLEPEASFRHKQIGDAYVSLERYEDALAEYRKAVVLDPQNAEIHGDILKMLLVLNRRDDAITECEMLKRLTPMATKDSCKTIVNETVGK
jgi:Flp pilus assembly protein TadD